jgi:predicted ATP-grasp superfamily ATP-dependent carboligase
MVQDIVPGSGTDHYMINGFFDRKSRPACLFVRRRLRTWPLSFGTSTAAISFPLSQISDMKQSLIDYLSRLNFRGIVDAEFMVDSRDQVGKLLDVNPRAFGGGGISSTFAASCGVNIIWTAYLDTLEREWRYQHEYEVGVYCFNLVLDLLSVGAMMRQGQLSVSEWVSQILSKNHFCVYAKDDLKPFLMHIYHKVRDTLKLERIQQLGTHLVEPL